MASEYRIVRFRRPDEVISRHQTMDELEEAVKKLTPMQRKTYHWYYSDGNHVVGDIVPVRSLDLKPTAGRFVARVFLG